MHDERCFNCDEEMKDCDCNDTEGYSNNGAVCPHCGHIDLASESEGHLYKEGEEENDCPKCGRTYEMDIYVSYTWTTRRKG